MNRIIRLATVVCFTFSLHSSLIFASQVDPATKLRLENSLAKLPLRFEKNEGQTSDAVKFLSRGSGYTLYFTPTESVMVLSRVVNAPPPEKQLRDLMQAQESVKRETSVLRMQVVGANKDAIIKGEDKLPGTSNYFKGSDPGKWRQGVANYKKVHYEEVYPGIDLVYYGNQRKLEYDFVVKPGADPEKIQLHFKGADTLSIDDKGNLVLETKTGNVVQHAPIVYQTIGGEKQSVEGRYVIKDNHSVAFKLVAYNPRHNLVIDPVLEYSTFLGGTGTDSGNSIAVDSTGNTYVTGSTGSTDFPVTAGTFDVSQNGGTDAFVTKINAAGSALVYSTYLGGSDTDLGNGIDVDSAGNAWVTGDTLSTDFPTTAGAFDTTHNGKQDVFVTQLNDTGSALVYSTYLGGSGVDRSNSIKVDSTGNAWVTGQNFSTDFPTTAGAFDTTHNGAFDAFVSKLNTVGSSLAYSTFLGGTSNDQARDIAVDNSGNAYVTGSTLSSNFPTTAGTIDTSYNGAFDAFVSKLNVTGSSLTYSTFLGGSLSDQGNGITVDSSDNALVTGSAGSSNFPTTAGAFDTTHNGGGIDAFVSKLNVTGSNLAYSTFLGGNAVDQANGIAVDSAGNAWVTGETRSADFPISTGAFDSTHNGLGDAFVSKLDTAGSSIDYSTFFGGSLWDKGQDIAVDSADKTYVIGNAGDAGFPTTTGAFDTSHNGSNDAFVLKLEEDLVPPVIILNGINPTHAELGQPYVDPGATAIDYVDGPLPISTISQAGVPGTFEVVYSATDNSGNTTTATRVVIPGDTTPPVITILGDNPFNSEIGLPFVDPGATAIDLVDGPLPVATATQLGATPGTLEVIYFATDNSGNTATATRVLNPVDTTPPVITILGANPINAPTGQPYVDPWATATDLVDGPVSVTAITQPGTASGTLEVVYSATDNSGNTATATRVVNIVP